MADSTRMAAVHDIKLELAAPEAPKSAARLAAEAAFSLPEYAVSQADPPLVSIRKNRVVANFQNAVPDAASDAVPNAGSDAASNAAKHSASSTSAMVDAAGSGPDAKSPRVFRIQVTPHTQPATALQPADGKLNSAPPNMSEPAQAVRVLRRKRLSTDKQPGPILHVFQAPIEQMSDADAAAEQPTVAKASELAALAAELAGLEPVFASIRRAQSFWFVEEQSDHRWQPPGAGRRREPKAQTKSG